MIVLVALLHILVGAVWLGAMAYSLGVVQPRMSRYLGEPTRVEEVYRELAAGNRWRVVAMIAVLAASGAAYVLLSHDAPDGQGAQGGWWWALVAAKAVLLLAAAALFWWVSWRGWPARIFALPDELPGLQRRFRRVALVMAALVGTAFALGVVAAHL